MATDDWPIPEDEAAEQAAADDDTTGTRPDTEADEADTLEQTREVPQDDEYREP